VLLRLGEVVAAVEGSACVARRAARAAAGELHVKASRRFDAEALAAISRAYARDAALTVVSAAVRWAGEAPRADAVHRAQAGLLADLDAVADSIYQRKA
jgi:hypothetical protein